MSTVLRGREWNPRVSKWKRAARLMLEWIRIVVEWIIHLNAALVNSSLGRTQHKERRTSHLLEFAVGVSPRNVLLLFLLLLMMPLLPPESQFGMLPQILRVPRLYCSDPVFNPLFLNISDHSRKSPFSLSPCVHFSLIQ